MPSVTDDIVSIGEIPLKFEPLRQKGTLGIGAHMSWKYFYSHRSHYEAYQSSPFLPLSILIFLFLPLSSSSSSRGSCLPQGRQHEKLQAHKALLCPAMSAKSSVLAGAQG